MTTFTVTLSRSGHNREIGTYNSLVDAKRAARAAGAIIPRSRPYIDVGLDVRGDDGKRDDAYGIWIDEINS